MHILLTTDSSGTTSFFVVDIVLCSCMHTALSFLESNLPLVVTLDTGGHMISDQS